MTRVLALATFKVFPPQMGGQKGVALFYRHLAQHMEVTLATIPANEVLLGSAYGLDIKHVLYPNRKIYGNLTRLSALRSLVQETAASVIISEHSYPASLGLWLRKRTGRPLIVHSHNIEALRFKQMGRWWWRQYLAYERWVHRQADFNFFISSEDKDFAISHFGLQPGKCAVITYGVEQKSFPPAVNKAALKRSLGFREEETLLLFNGTLDYTPNAHAVHDLIQKINPLLSSQVKDYRIVITGAQATRGVISALQGHSSISYLGFVDSIEPYYQAADLFLNPVINDSGVKTKVIEALSNNTTVVSFKAGATGIPREVCGDKLITVPNGDYEEFCRQVALQAKKEQPNTPPSFYEYYNWDNIAQKAATLIHKVIDQHV